MLTRIRSAITGRFVRRSTADRHPESTVAEQPDVRIRLKTERSGRQLRLEAIAAAAAGVVESRLDRHDDADLVGELFIRNLAAVGLPELRRLEGAVKSIDRPAPTRERAGRAAFEAYVARMGGQTHDGRDVPPWDELGDDVRAGWAAAAAAARLAR